MAKINYEELGFKSGIEIHQQLDGKKLFCRCSTANSGKEPDISITRRLRAVIGETGQVDAAAAFETARGKFYKYLGNSEEVCLVEIDEEPPHSINPESVKTTLMIAKMLNAKVFDEIQVMRKTVVDGSNVSGFQRSSFVARDGKLETSKGDVGISLIALEEEACQKAEEDNESVTYRLERLGIPLIEIATKADIKDPEHAKETAEKLGMILRSTGRVKRGIGTIRQDINVSIKEGNRIEIKGAQELSLIPQLIEFEVLRQKNLVEIAKELKNRNVEKQISEVVDLSPILKKSSSKIMVNAFAKNGVAYAIKIQGFAKLFGREIQPNRRFGTELSDRAKSAAGVGGLFHSDELPGYGITDAEVSEIKKKLKCFGNDGFVIVADSKEKVENALFAVIERANEAIDGVPREVRKANPDGTTSYERPMPGAARMYPETDIPPFKPEMKGIESVELIEDKIKRFVKMELSEDLATTVAKSGKVELFEEFSKRFKNIKPAFIASTLVSTTTQIRREFNLSTEDITKESFAEIFHYLDEGKIPKEAVMNILIDYAKGSFRNIKDYAMITDAELEKELRKIVEQSKGAPLGALMGIAMSKFRGKASGQKIAEILKKLSS